MKLIRVEAWGFRSYPELTLDFNACRLVRVCGRNGEGKSAIIESLAWTIFRKLRGGSTIRDATHRGFSPAMIPECFKPPAPPCVRWTAEIEGERIRISRCNGGARVETGQEVQTGYGGPQSEHRQIVEGSQPAADHMVKLLGIDYDDLRATAWCLQGEVMRPIRMTKRERRNLIRRLLLEKRESGAAERNPDAEPADTVRKARQELKNAQRKLEEAKSDLTKAEEHKFRARERFDALRDRWTASLERRSRHEVLSATIRGFERERDGLQRHLDDCVADLREMQQIKNRAARFDQAELDGAVGQMDRDLTELDRLETAFRDTRERRLIRNAAAKARGDWYAGVSDTLTSAIARGECSTCERRIRRGRSTLTKKLDHAAAEAKRYRVQSARTATPGREETDLSDDIRRLRREIDARQERVSGLRYEHGYSEAAKSLLHRIPSQVAKRAELEGRLSKVVRGIEKHTQELDASGYCDEKHQRLGAEVDDAKTKWDEARARAREKREVRDRLADECVRLAQTAVDTAAEAVGVRTDEDDVRSRLEERMDDIVKELTDRSHPPLAVSVDKHFRPTLHKRDRDGPVMRSGGLDVMVALAMRLALVRLIRERRGKPGSICDLVILDEPFGNVDSPRAERFLDLLLKDEELRVLEISSASRVEHLDPAKVLTIHVEGGSAEVDRAYT